MAVEQIRDTNDLGSLYDATPLQKRVAMVQVILATAYRIAAFAFAAIKISKQQGLTELAAVLEELCVPSKESSAAEWWAFRTQLVEIFWIYLRYDPNDMLILSTAYVTFVSILCIS